MVSGINMTKKKIKAVVLLSGGIDSATTLAIARNAGFEIYALSFSYGQRHAVELKAARRIAKENKSGPAFDPGSRFA